jgi:hypothetical protein
MTGYTMAQVEVLLDAVFSGHRSTDFDFINSTVDVNKALNQCDDQTITTLITAHAGGNVSPVAVEIAKLQVLAQLELSPF